MRRFSVRAGIARALCRAWLPASLKPLLSRQDPYKTWRKVNTLGSAARDDLAAALASRNGNLPLVSVIMPVFRPDPLHFRAAVASLQSQLHADWQLCICDDGSAQPDLTAALTSLAANDRRIVITALHANRGISAATNAAATLASGEVLLFMDQDDLLATDCIAEFALAFGGASDLDLAYSDSDKVDPAGRHSSPSFKPGWSPQLLLSYMYLSHVVAMRTSLFARLGGMRSAFDGSQDFDLALRAAELAGQVHHIPRILYHWRVGPGSTALSSNEKPGSVAIAKVAVEQALVRRGIDASVTRPLWAERAALGLFELRFPTFRGKISVIVVCERDTPDDDRLNMLRANASAEVEVILAPPSAHGHLSDRIASAVARASGDMVVCATVGLVAVDADWLAQLCGHASISGVGLVGLRLVRADGKLDSAGMVAPSPELAPEFAFSGLDEQRAGAMYLARTTHDCLAVPADCIAISRSELDRIGGIPAGLDDFTAFGAALSARVRQAGSTVLVCAGTTMRTEQASPSISQLPTLAEDPWYNRNLGRDRNQFKPSGRCPEVRSVAPVRLAVVTHNLDREGAQSTLFDLIAGLKEAGHAEPIVISQRDGVLSEDLRGIGIAVHIIPSPGRRAQSAKLDSYRKALARAYLDVRAEAVLANTLESHAAVAAAAEIGLGSIWWQHEGGPWHRYFRHLPIAARARAFAAFAQAYRVVQVADATRQAWLPLATRDNFELIRHGIPSRRMASDLARWDRIAARQALGIDGGDCCVLLLGSVSRRKGQEDVLRALATMPAEAAVPLRIMIVGALVDPSYQRRIETILANLPDHRRARVTIAGAVADAALYFAAADIFVCCSRQESAPRAIVEAMAFGLPVVTTPVDGIPELVQTGCNGLFYKPGDFGYLAILLVQLATSPREIERLGDAGRKRVAQVSDFEAMIARFAALVREAAWTGQRPAPAID